MGCISDHVLDRDFTRKAFGSMMGILPNLAKPFSAVECGLDENDYKRLLEWISADVTVSKINFAFHGLSRRLYSGRHYYDEVVIGLLLHLLYAEHIRRHGHEYLYWPNIAKLPWNHAHQGWFLADGTPSVAHRDILANSAETFGLRQSREEEGAQWFMTGKLQVGFTANGAAAHLQDWLTNPHAMTKPIKMLLGQGSDPGLKSDSFSRLFGLLKGFRIGNVTENILDRELVASPWILHEPQYISLIKKAALAESAFNGVAGDGYSPEFMTPFYLNVAGHNVTFKSSIEGLGLIGLSEFDHVISTKDGRYSSKVTFDADRGFIPYPQSFEVSFVDAAQPLIFEIKRKDSPQVIFSQQLHGWDPGEWVQVFNVRGRRLPLDMPLTQADVAAGLTLIIPSTCILHGNFTGRQQIDPNWMLYINVTKGPDDTLSVISDNEVIWDLQSARSSMQIIEDLDAYVVHGVNTNINIRCAVRVELIRGFILEAIWLGRDKMRLDHDGLPAEFQLSQEQLMDSISVTIRARHVQTGMTGLVRKKIDLVPRNFVWLRERHGDGTTLNSLLIGSDTSPDLRIGNLPEGSTPLLFEGSRFISLCPGHRFKPSGLRGLGEKLTLWPRMFNETQETYILAKRCLDQGIIFKCRLMTAAPGLLLEVQLSNPSINLVNVKWFMYTRGPKCVQLESDWVQGESVLSLRGSDSIELRDLLCVVAVFEGVRVGVWHNRVGQEMAYQIFLAAEEAAETDPCTGAMYADLIRSSRAPILCEYSLPVVRSWLKHSKIDALIGLIVPKVSSMEIPFVEDSTCSTSWLDAVGLCYDGPDRDFLRPISGEDAASIWKALMPNVEPMLPITPERMTDIFILVKRLAAISPFFARDVLVGYLTELNTMIDFQQWRTELRQVLGVNHRDYEAIGRIAGDSIDPAFFIRNLMPINPAGVLTRRNQLVLFGLGSRLPYNTPKQYYLSQIL